MEHRPGKKSSRARKKKVGAQQETGSHTISGRGRVLLIREFLKQDETYATLQSVLGQPPKDLDAEPTCSQATDSQSSFFVARRGLKRTSDCLAESPEAPAAKSKRGAKNPVKSENPETSENPEKSENPERPENPETPDCPEKTENPESPEKPESPESPEKPKWQLLDLEEKESSDHEGPQTLHGSCSSAQIAQLTSEPGKQLLLVLCHASALGTQLPRLQLLLQQVRVQDRRPPAAIVGILVQPRPDEEAEARLCLENLLCSVFASENPEVEVHTAVFCPSRPQGALQVHRATSQGHMVPLVDRQTQTDGEGLEGGDWDYCSPEKRANP